MPEEEIPDSVFEEIGADILEDIGDPVPVTFAATVVYAPILLASVALCVFWQESLPEQLNAPGILQDLGIGLGIGLALVILTVSLARHVGPLRELEIEFRKVLGPLPTRNIVYLALLSGLAEEICFRGWMQPWLGFVWASIVFGALHFVPSKVFVPWTIFAFGVGFIFGALYLWRESLVAPITAHVFVNGINLHLIVTGRRLPENAGAGSAGLSSP